MSAQEFVEWRAFFDAEQIVLAEERKRGAVQVIATLRAGGVQKPGGQGWSITDFAPVDVWQPYRAPAPAAPGEKKVSEAARMRAFNRGRGHG